MEIDPNHVGALHNYAIMLKDQYNAAPNPDLALLEQAVVLCEGASAVQPNHSKVWNTKGVLHKKLGQYPDAIAAYEKSIQLEEGNAAAWENRGIAYALYGDFVRAERDLRQAVAITGTTEKLCETGWRSLASLYLFRGSPEAIQHIDQAFACAGRDPWSSLVTARLRLQLDGHVDYQEFKSFNTLFFFLFFSFFSFLFFLCKISIHCIDLLLDALNSLWAVSRVHKLLIHLYRSLPASS